MGAIKARKEIKEQELFPTIQQEISSFSNVELELLRKKTLIREQEIDFDYMAQHGYKSKIRN